MSGDYEQASDERIERDPAPEEEARAEREAALADPRAEPGEAPEGRHPGAEGLPQGDPEP
jgi:hypothetical protein